MIVVQNHAERDGYYHQSSITLRVMITAWNHAERDDYCLPSHEVWRVHFSNLAAGIVPHSRFDQSLRNRLG